MSPKVAIIMLVGALCFGPAAYIAGRNQVRLHAYETEGAIAAQSVRVARANQPAPVARTVELAPVLITARGTVRAVVRDEVPLTCQPWRPLLTGPGAADALAPMVRACDAAEMLDGSDPAPASARLPPPPARPRAPHTHWEYTVDPGASGRPQ